MENFIHSHRYYCCVVVSGTADLTFYLAVDLSSQSDFTRGSTSNVMAHVSSNISLIEEVPAGEADLSQLVHASLRR